MSDLVEIERYINSIIETDYTVDSISSDLCPEGFYRVTRFKARERVIGKYEPFIISKELFYNLNSIPYTYVINQNIQLCQLTVNHEIKQTVYGDLTKLPYTSVVFEGDITIIGLYCLAHKVWKKEWKLPRLECTSSNRKQLLGWLVS